MKSKIPLYYDFHLHTCLSPCGEDDMTPANVVHMAALLGLQAIAITDHNSCKNCEAAMFHGKNSGVIVIPGMELTTMEDVHVVCLFRSLVSAKDFDYYVSDHMLAIPNRPTIFGEQLVLNEKDEVIGTEKNLLISATDISFDDCFDLVASYNGVAFPAHIDRGSHSVLSNLGFFPPDSTFATVEVKDLKKLHSLQASYPYVNSCNIISNSDAHSLTAIRDPNYRIFVDEVSIDSILDFLEKVFIT